MREDKGMGHFVLVSEVERMNANVIEAIVSILTRRRSNVWLGVC